MACKYCNSPYRSSDGMYAVESNEVAVEREKRLLRETELKAEQEKELRRKKQEDAIVRGAWMSKFWIAFCIMMIGIVPAIFSIIFTIVPENWHTCIVVSGTCIGLTNLFAMIFIIDNSIGK